MALPSLARIRSLFRAARDDAALVAALDDTAIPGPGGLTLRQRLVRARNWILGQTEALLQESVARGEPPETVAQKVREFFDAELAPIRNERGRLVRTAPRGLVRQAPGRAGSASVPLRRLIRHELVRAHGRATVWAAQRAPMEMGVAWRLSARHPKPDACDVHASLDTGLGPGVYRPNAVPPYPEHVNDLCHLEPVVLDAGPGVVARLRRLLGGR